MLKEVFMFKKLSQIDLTNGKEWKKLLLFAFPIIISYLLQQVYTISDAAICGQTLSSNEVAGVNDAAPIIFIFLQFAFGCTAGFTVITSYRIGNSDYKGIKKSFACQIVLCLIVTIVLTILSILLLNPMLQLINVTKEANIEVYEAAYSYCIVIFLGIIAQMYYNFICSILRSLGDSITPLIFLFISTVLNIGLDFLFIMVFRLGVIGAALATVIAQGISTICCFIYSFKKYDYLRLSFKDFRIDVDEYMRHLKQGIPLGLQFSILFFGVIILQSKIVLFDLMPSGIMVTNNPVQNGYGAANKLNGLIMTPYNGLGTAIVSFNAQNFGAKKYDRIKRGLYQSLIISLIFFVVFAGTGALLTINGAYQYIFLSHDKISEASLKYGNMFLYVEFSLYPFLGGVFVFRNAIQGVGKSFYTLLSGIAELVGRITVCLFLPTLVNGGPLNSLASDASFIALCLADPFAWIASCLVLTYPTIKYLIKQKYYKTSE